MVLVFRGLSFLLRVCYRLTICKVTSSGKGFMIVDDDGNIFMTSIAYLQSLLVGKLKAGFILLNRLPGKASSNRFKKSPLWDDGVKKDAPESVGEDALSVKSTRASREKKSFEDKEVW